MTSLIFKMLWIIISVIDAPSVLYKRPSHYSMLEHWASIKDHHELGMEDYWRLQNKICTMELLQPFHRTESSIIWGLDKGEKSPDRYVEHRNLQIHWKSLWRPLWYCKKIPLLYGYDGGLPESESKPFWFLPAKIQLSTSSTKELIVEIDPFFQLDNRSASSPTSMADAKNPCASWFKPMNPLLSRSHA